MEKSFADRYIRGHDPMTGKHCENVFSGQELAYHLRLGQMWSQAETDSVISRLNHFYYPCYWGLGYPEGTYDEWTPYLLVHYGGLLLHTGRLDEWMALQKDAYMRQYQDRDRVFDHPLNILPWVGKPKLTSGNIKSKKQYISIPSVWRNYCDLIGYSRDARTKEVWLTTILYNTDRMEGAYFISPETDGTIDVAVRVNGKACRVRRVGEGYAKELVAEWKGKADASGVTVEVVGRRNAPRRHTPAKPDRDFATAFKPCAMSPFEGLYAAKADCLAGTEVKGGIVTSCNNFDYILFANVDFGKGGIVGRGDTRQQQIRRLRTGGGPRRQLGGGSSLVQAAMHRRRVARDRDSRG